MILKISAFILLTLSGYILKKSKLYVSIVFILLGLLTFYSTNIADFSSYQNIYIVIGQGEKYTMTGQGWWLLCKLGNLLGLNFIQFKVIVLLVGLCLIWYTFWRMKIENNFVLASYLIYPAVTDIIQIRFFLGLSIVIFASYYLLKRTPKDYAVYFVCVIIAAQIHNSMYFYLIFIFWHLFLKCKKIATFASVVLVAFFLIDKGWLISLISKFGNEQENNFYFSSQYYSTLPTTMLYVGTTITFFFISIYICKNLRTENTLYLNYTKFVAVANYISIFLILLGSLSFTFLRVQKPMWLFNYVDVVLLCKKETATKSKIDPKVLQIVYIILALVWLLLNEKQAIKDILIN